MKRYKNTALLVLLILQTINIWFGYYVIFEVCNYELPKIFGWLSLVSGIGSYLIFRLKWGIVIHGILWFLMTSALIVLYYLNV